MSSSQEFLHSSPELSLTIGGARRRSQFTYKHLAQLASCSTSCPLRVIAHIDLDAFYAQCEMVRLDISETQPLAVQQWQGLIAINYAAREYGMNRHININEAKRLCPNIVLQHVATWKEGEERWQYHQDAYANMATHKVSLDPYRRESRKILACIKGKLPVPPLQKVEKASIDEVFLDLSAHIHSILIERYPELSLVPQSDPTGNLPPPPTSALDWNSDALVDLDHEEAEAQDPDWDDVCTLIGSEIVRAVRAEIRQKLKYTCSAGIAQNKMLSKLASGHKKPNQQTVIRNRAVSQFLKSFKFTKIRNLGGKLGDEVVAAFGTEELTELLEVPLEQLQYKFGDDTGSWLHRIIRGEDHSEVNSRTEIKSMLSAKSFRPSINNYDQAIRWLRIFVADIFSRLVEEGVLDHRRRPKTMNLHHRQSSQTRSRQIPIPSGKAVDEAMLFGLAKTLLGHIIANGRAWPCANLSLSVGGFEDGPADNKGIGTFLLKGEEAKVLNYGHRTETASAAPCNIRPKKRRRLSKTGIETFFSKRKGSEMEEDNEGYDKQRAECDLYALHCEPKDENEHLSLSADEQGEEPTRRQCTLGLYSCPKCGKAIPNAGQAEHEDWHFAKELQLAEQLPTLSPAEGRPKKSTQPNPQSRAKRIGNSAPEKGQGRLNFAR